MLRRTQSLQVLQHLSSKRSLIVSLVTGGAPQLWKVRLLKNSFKKIVRQCWDKYILGLHIQKVFSKLSPKITKVARYLLNVANLFIRIVLVYFMVLHTSARLVLFFFSLHKLS